MRNYSLEFMRIFLILLVVWGHLISQLPMLEQSVGIYPNSEMAVQSFFMLGSFFAYFNLKKYNFVDLIVKIYHRLFSPFLFTVILSILFSYSSPFDFFKALFLLPGLYPNSQITGWGDWFLGVYFWVICFYIYIYTSKREWANFITILLVFSFFCIKENALVDNGGFMSTYWHMVPSELPRGFIGIGIGFLIGYVVDNIKIKKSVLSIIVFTAFELYFLRLFIYFLIQKKYNFNYLEWGIINCFLIYSFYNLNGMVSILLNKISKVQLISRYVFSFFIAHMVPILQVVVLHKDEYPAIQLGVAFFSVTLLITFVEYHLFSKRLYPYAVAWLRKILF